MSESLYELLALGARYIFAGLMALIVVRAWRNTIVDSRRAKTLRRISPQTGIIGELMVMEGSEKARRGMKYKVIREGQIGSSRRADIRVRHSSVRRRHAYFLLTEDGLRVRAHAGAPLRDEEGMPVREIILNDGDSISVGRVQLMLILSRAPEEDPVSPVRRRKKRAAGNDGGFDDEQDDLFGYDDDMPDGEDDLFTPSSDPFDVFAAGTVNTQSLPRRRHLPLTFEENTRRTSESLYSRKPYGPTRRYTPDGEYIPMDRKTSGRNARVEDNPLNHRHPRGSASGYPGDSPSDNSEMW